jgi:hypothetical protein
MQQAPSSPVRYDPELMWWYQYAWVTVAVQSGNFNCGHTVSIWRMPAFLIGLT